MKQTILLVIALLLVPCGAKAQTYMFSLNDDPSVCFPGECETVRAYGVFTVGYPIVLAGNTLYPITYLSGLLGFSGNAPGLPIVLYQNNYFHTINTPILTNFPLWLQNPQGLSRFCIQEGAGGDCQGAGTGPARLVGVSNQAFFTFTAGTITPMLWAAGVTFKVYPVFQQSSLFPSQSNLAVKNLGLEVGIPLAAAFVESIVRHELRVHRKSWREKWPNTTRAAPKPSLSSAPPA
jgi:hypothetical protein